jgi:GTP cyclohydrolase FolE2
MQNLGTISKFKIKVVNEESIHPHDACSYIGRKLKGKQWVKDDSAFKN